MAMRVGLIKEILQIAVQTLHANKLRSSLTILGVVIGVTSIVAMTSLINGFGESLDAQIRQLGSNTVYLQKFGIQSFASGKEFLELIKRPNLNEDDARLIAESPLVERVGFQVGGGGPFTQMQRVTFGGDATKAVPIIGATANFAETNFIALDAGRPFVDFEVTNRRQVTLLGFGPAETLFWSKGIDPIGKEVRIGGERYTVIGAFAKRPSALGDADGFVVLPFTTYEKKYPTPRFRGILNRPLQLAISAAPGVTQEELQAEIEQIMRSRHRLRLGEENDFDMMTADSIMGFVRQFTQAVVLALVVISSIALMVGGIGVMAIMTISVTERTREIGIRKALGARRREILFQFLLEAVFLTSLGGLLGILLGSGIAVVVTRVAGFPAALPLWSFALGVGFSASVGIIFGMLPALKASRMDPIEALRYE
jgi:putative ABC transport system permease protein